MTAPLVLGVVGTSYCGSTILELLLATHPEIATLGEGWHLCEPQYSRTTWDVVCSACRFTPCPVFPQDRMPFQLADIHAMAAAHAGTPWVVDASKWWPYFEEVRTAGGVAAMGLVLLIKRPEPQIGSFLKHHPDRTGAEMAQTYVSWYDGASRWLQTAGIPFLVLPYDELTTDVVLALSRIRAFMDHVARNVGCPPLSSGFALDRLAVESHRIGGNTAVVYGQLRPVRPDESWREQDWQRVSVADRCGMWETYYRIVTLRSMGFRYG